MAFTKETARKAGKKSSRKGVPNRSTLEIREDVQKIVEKLTPQVLEDIESMEPEKRVQHFTKLLEFVLPKAQPEEQHRPDTPILHVDMSKWI